MIRVAYIAGEPNPYRAPHLDRIAARPEIELTVIYASRSVQRREWTVELAHDPVILRGPRLPAMRLLHHDYPLTPQIWPLLERERFDVLVIGGWSLLATQLAILWARLRKVPYLLVSENHLREPRPAWIRGLKRIVLPRIVPQAAGHLVTGTLAREHQLSYGARPETITVFPNTVDVADLARQADALAGRRAEIRAALGIADGAVAVVQVGRLIPLKAPDEAVEAVGRARRLTERPLHLVFVGSGTMQEALAARASELDVPVTFAGWRSGTELVEAYVAADVFLLLSRRETWGVVVNEAAACGLPLVLTERVGASADLLVPGENGELVPSADVEAQAAALAALAEDDERRARFGRRSRAVVDGWGYDESVTRFVEAVCRVTGGR